MKFYYVYIIECSDSSYYTGLTNNIEERFAQHQSGYVIKCYTFKRRPLKLSYSLQLTDINQAIALEKQIKGWSRKKKKAFINEDWLKLKILSRNYTENSKPYLEDELKNIKKVQTIFILKNTKQLECQSEPVEDGIQL